MPLRIVVEDGIMLNEFSGELTTEDLGLLVAESVNLEKSLPRTPDRLADLTATTGVYLNYNDIDRLARARIAHPPANPIKTAVVAPRPVQFGLARMFQSLNPSHAVTVEIFRDRADALAWLKSTPPST